MRPVLITAGSLFLVLISATLLALPPSTAPANDRDPFFQSSGAGAATHALPGKSDLSDLKWIGRSRNRELEKRWVRMVESFFGAMPALIALYHLILFLLYREMDVPLWSGILGVLLTWMVFMSPGDDPVFSLISRGHRGDLILELLAAGVLFISFSSWVKDPGNRKIATIMAGLFFLSSAAVFLNFLNLTKSGFAIVTGIGATLISAYNIFHPGMGRRKFLAFFLYAGLATFMVIPRLFSDSILDRLPLFGFGHMYLAIHAMVVGFNLDQAKKKIQSMNLNLQRRIDQKSRRLGKTLDAVKEREAILQLELDIAGEIQESLLPAMPMVHDACGIRMDGTCQYRDGVGGDFYDVIHLPENRMAILLADVSGSGIPAALVAIMARIVFRDAIRKSESPTSIFYEANRILVESVSSREYLSAFLLVLDPAGGCVYANAGHPWPLVYRHRTGVVQEWSLTGGLFIGALKNSAQLYGEKIDFLERGDRVLFYSDGIVDQESPGTGIPFGSERLSGLFMETVAMEPGEAREYIMSAWDQHRKNAPVRDDVSILILEKTD